MGSVQANHEHCPYWAEIPSVEGWARGNGPLNGFTVHTLAAATDDMYKILCV